MVAVGSRDQVGGREHKEGEARQRPRSQRPTGPFQYFPEIVGTGDETESSTLGDGVATLAGFAQTQQGRVGVDVEGHSRKENRKANKEAGVGQPFDAVFADLRDEPGIDVGVDYVEEEARSGNGDWHPLAFRARPKRVDERAVQVVDLPQGKEHQWHDFPSGLPHEIHVQKDDHGWQFHDNPARPIGEVRSPADDWVVAAEWGRAVQQVQEGRNCCCDDRPHQGVVDLQFIHLTHLFP